MPQERAFCLNVVFLYQSSSIFNVGFVSLQMLSLLTSGFNASNLKLRLMYIDIWTSYILHWILPIRPKDAKQLVSVLLDSCQI